jgi:uncharacterized protein YndB with AHSA1/START domain
MKILKGLFIAALALVAVFVGVGLLFLPASVHVERSTVIDASPAEVYPLVASLERFNEWSPWAGLDPAAVYEFTGPAAGVGARMTWRSDKPEVGAGSQEVIAAVENREVTVRLAFEGQGEALAGWTLEPQGEGTLATWSFDMDLGMNPVMRWMGLMIDGPIGADYEFGLSRLKEVAEQEAAEARAVEAAARAGPGDSEPAEASGDPPTR